MPPHFLDWSLMGVTALKLALAWVLALPTGWWREREAHGVGVRTFPVVAIASCGYLLLLHGIPGPDGLSANSRVLQGLVAGIGFVGGGAIVKEGITTHGTATAASVWCAGAIGGAIATDHWVMAIMVTVFNLLALRGLAPVKAKLDRAERRLDS